MQGQHDRKLGRRRLLAVAVLFLSVTASSSVAACAESDKFDFKPRGMESPIRHQG